MSFTDTRNGPMPHTIRKRTYLGFAAIALAMTVASGIASAAPIQFTGDLTNSADPRIIGPGIDGAGALFDPFNGVNNVVLYAFTLTAPADVTFIVPGADANRIDPYLSIFTGSGNSASFLSSFAGAFFGDPIDVTQNL